jgi:hypothetical protein
LFFYRPENYGIKNKISITISKININAKVKFHLLSEKMAITHYSDIESNKMDG